jgi:5-methylcytosine-specific restriction endonuclease McrA
MIKTGQERRTWASREGLYNTKSWWKLRSHHMNEYPTCAMCETMGFVKRADVVDHIVPITEENWKELFLDPKNLQSLCNECHQFKTNRDKIVRHGNCGIYLMDEILNM